VREREEYRDLTSEREKQGGTEKREGLREEKRPIMNRRRGSFMILSWG